MVQKWINEQYNDATSSSLSVLYWMFLICPVYCLIAQISLGVVHGQGLQKPILSSRTFHGCLENVLYNELNLIDVAKKSNQQVSVVVSCVFSFTKHC